MEFSSFSLAEVSVTVVTYFYNAAPVQTNIVSDDKLMRDALRATGLKTLVSLNKQAEIRRLRDLDLYQSGINQYNQSASIRVNPGPSIRDRQSGVNPGVNPGRQSGSIRVNPGQSGVNPIRIPGQIRGQIRDSHPHGGQSGTVTTIPNSHQLSWSIRGQIRDKSNPNPIRINQSESIRINPGQSPRFRIRPNSHKYRAGRLQFVSSQLGFSPWL
jgi:hypothetical protein